jgi:AGCS family alanine or glycine:cation symporter
LTKKKWVITLYRLLSGGVMVIFGALASLDLVWSLGDLFMALLTACNLYAIARLSKYAFRLLDDYRAQKKAGKNPVFSRGTMPDLELEGWD